MEEKNESMSICISQFCDFKLKNGLKESTVEQYRRCLNRFMNWLIETGRDFEDVASKDVEEFLVYSASVGFSKSTVQGILTYLQVFFRFLGKETLIADLSIPDDSYFHSKIKTCIVCGKQFHSTRTYQSMICSNDCWSRYTTKFGKQTCKNCGQTFKRNGIVTLYCSEQCKQDYIESAQPYFAEKKKLDTFKSAFSQLQDISSKSESIIMKYGERTISTWLLGGFTEKLKEAVLERDGYRCYICGNQTNLHVHHIIPRAMGGPHIPENLVTLCAGCHRSVESGNIDLAVKNCVKRALNNGVYD